MQPLTLIATAAFGLEAVVARELSALGYGNHAIEDGRLRFAGDALAIARCNLWLRSADRVLLEVGRFDAHDFGQLFDQTHDIPWEHWLNVDAQFPVRGRSVKSQLHSVPDCQRLVKKAIVERLKHTYRREWFDETGPLHSVEVSLLKDRVSLTIDTSGPGLHKRGYRTLVGSAPLKETLAAALIQLSYWNPGRPLVDPCCGSGTIPIEAALIGRNIAPGRNRTFPSEAWPQLPATAWSEARREAHDVQRPTLAAPLIGADIDPRALHLARQHAQAAGVMRDIQFRQQAVADFAADCEYGCMITNPPYGERLGDKPAAEQLYRDMGRRFRPLTTWSKYILTAHADFEKLYGQRADRRRKLYNARIACTYYQYNGPRPPD